MKPKKCSLALFLTVVAVIPLSSLPLYWTRLQGPVNKISLHRDDEALRPASKKARLQVKVCDAPVILREVTHQYDSGLWRGHCTGLVRSNRSLYISLAADVLKGSGQGWTTCIVQRLSWKGKDSLKFRLTRANWIAQSFVAAWKMMH